MYKTLTVLALATSGLGMQLKSLVEVQTTQQCAPVNVLFKAPATESYPAYGADGDANHATDGGKQCSWGQVSPNTLTHTAENNPNPWW